MKILTSVLLATTILASAAHAQTATPATPAPAAPAATTTTTTATTAMSGQWRASKLMGLDIYNDQNEKLGDVSEVIIDRTGKVAGLVIGVGGFLGMGQRDVMVTMDKLKFVNEPMRTTTTTTTTAPNTGTATPAPAQRAATANKWFPDHAILSGVTKDALKSMAEFKYE